VAETVEERGEIRSQLIQAHVDRLWAAALRSDEQAAVDVLLDALRSGIHPESILLDIIGSIQRRVGLEWSQNRIDVAQEHAVTAINEYAVTHLSAYVARRQVTQPRIAVACLDGEWHAMPARMLAEVLKLRGFGVDYLGAQVPTHHLVNHLQRTGTDAVALSGSLSVRLPGAHAAIMACQAAGVPVIVGGAAFGVTGRWAEALGADAWAPDARTAADLLARPLPRSGGPREPIEDLPHLADQEYAQVERAAPRLVADVMAGLEERLPIMATYTELQRRHTAEDVAHIVEFLGAALYVGDVEVFLDFLAWTSDVLKARRVPPRSLIPAIELLREELRELPRAVGMLWQASALLNSALLG
jgi:methanogenic corrinoid protein MtbC1